MSLADRFGAFFAAANRGSRPYPWQCALVEEIAETGRWPDIAAPTGAGKSSVVDVHVFLVAEHASGRLAVRPPRRLVLVAPRRVLVDDQFERATRLAAALAIADPTTDSPLGSAAAALRPLWTSVEPPAPPLGVWRLRGGVRLDTGWRLEPAACQIICATPQMWGSRLLLRGYSASRASRNLESGLLAHDVAAVVDEAHLHERLIDTGRNLAARSTKGPAPLQVVGMSATGRASPGQIGLSDADLADPALSRRVNAVKLIDQVAVEDLGHGAEAALVSSARNAAGRGTVGVFVNDVPSALGVAGALGADGATVELVCGRMRPADLQRLRERRPGLLTAAGADVDFLVSTQSLEVGVDLDLPAVVTMIAPASALAQRAGRLNRSGTRLDSTLTVITMPDMSEREPEETPRSGPYEGADLIAGARWLEQLGGSISPHAVAAAGLPERPRPLLPALRAVDLETLDLTSEIQSADPDPDLYLEDPREAAPEIGIVARRHLELEPAVVSAMLTACPPRAHEIASLSVASSKELDRILEIVADTAWVVRAGDGDLTAERVRDQQRLRPGDVLVVSDGAPICTAGIVGIGRGKQRTGAPLREVLADAPAGASHDEIVPIAAAEIASVLAADPALGSRAARNDLVLVLDSSSHPALAERLRRHRRLSELELRWCGGAGAETGLLVVSDMSARAVQSPGFAPDGLVTLEAHQAAVERRLLAVLDALALELPGEERSALLLAARCHDEGKRHPRFQRRMGASDGSVPLAKPRPGHRPDRGDGWRHEQLSTAWAAHHSENNPLVVSLVGAHHGRGRAHFDRGAADLLDSWAECPPEIEAHVHELFGAFGRYELLRSAARTRCGVLRLTWLEALLRCADMQVSREGG